MAALPFDRLLAAAPLTRDPAGVRARIELAERIMENLVPLPGLGRGVGLDAALDLVPVAGDVVGALIGLWLVWEARNLGMSRWAMARMIGNVGFDAALGAIPFVGILFDAAFRSNTRNLRIIRRHLDRHHPATALIER